jgi:hypothetical protein
MAVSVLPEGCDSFEMTLSAFIVRGENWDHDAQTGQLHTFWYRYREDEGDWKEIGCTSRKYPVVERRSKGDGGSIGE